MVSFIAGCAAVGLVGLLLLGETDASTEDRDLLLLLLAVLSALGCGIVGLNQDHRRFRSQGAASVALIFVCATVEGICLLMFAGVDSQALAPVIALTVLTGLTGLAFIAACVRERRATPRPGEQTNTVRSSVATAMAGFGVSVGGLLVLDAVLAVILYVAIAPAPD